MYDHSIHCVSPDDMHDWILLLDTFNNLWADSTSFLTCRDKALDVGKGEYFATEDVINAYMCDGVL